ncbi:MAG: TldD/PmbA family protein [Candidatus Thorarchaeota archaeon]|nr:MAG: TldD/PmbA family protein [Candidatus Thorarchaeota archaeon]
MNEELSTQAIKTILDEGAEFADIRIERTRLVRLEVIDGEVKEASSALIRGAGLRAFLGGAWAFSQTSDLTIGGMVEAGKLVTQVARMTSKTVKDQFELQGPTFTGKASHPTVTSLREVSMEEKVGFLKELNETSSTTDESIVRARTTYDEQTVDVFVANSFGTEVAMSLSLPQLKVFAIARKGARSHRGFDVLGGSGGYEVVSGDAAFESAQKAPSLAAKLLESRQSKGGVQDIIIDPDLTGVLAHEAFGHACEADNWTSKGSVFIDKFQQRLGIEDITIIDDPTRKGLRGSFEYDWEGTKSKKRVLIKKGILNELLHTLGTSSQLDMVPNGAARSQSFMYEPIPRMGVTLVEPGNWTLDEMISDMKTGLLMCGVGGGYTLSDKGQFMFRSTHGYEIENGELGQMIHGASMVGLHLDTLSKIDAVGNDVDLYSGTCGKSAQHVPDTSGGPPLRLREMNVGGA